VSFARFFDNPLFGQHFPLVLGWSDDQLWPIVDQLAGLLPLGLTDEMQLAIASCARSIAAERKLTGCGVRYARAKEAYRVPQRYRRGDPRYTCHYITRSMNILKQIGLIDQALGIWCPGDRGFQSVVWATDELMKRLGPLIDAEERRALPTRDEAIVLRDRANKKEVDYTDTDETTAMREQLQIVNDALAQLQLYHGQYKLDIPVGRRIFNGSFDRGGRFYCHGPSFQNVPAEQRRELEVVIEGAAHPMVEIDYSNLHIEMAYREARKRMRRGDQYAIEGLNRALVKMAVNTVLNARSDNSGILAIADKLYRDREFQVASGITGGSRSECRELAKKVVKAIKHKHWRIEKYFGSDCGARFQRRDSDMAMQIMHRMVRRTGRCPLPVHDSFLVAEIDADALEETMKEVAREYKLRPTLKSLRSGQPPTPIPYMEVTASELHRQGRRVDRRKQALRGKYSLRTSRCDDVPRSPTAGFLCCHDPPHFNPRTLRHPSTDGTEHLSWKEITARGRTG
jgi:hypothetical protein